MMKMLDVFRAILGGTLTDEMAAEDVLLRAVVLHTHSVVLRREVALEDCPASERTHGHWVLAPLTRRCVAGLIAERWNGEPIRGGMHEWLGRYERETPYELFSDVPPEHRERALAAKAEIEQHPLVESLVAE